jgi:lactate dehydrogenase-like 2-hydroxyacid dehydrogenase
VGPLPDDLSRRLADRYDVQTLGWADAADGHPALAQADGLLVTTRLVVDQTLLDAAPRLQVVALSSVGYDRVDVQACAGRGVWVTNSAGTLDGAVADLTVLLMLGVARRIEENAALVRSGRWFTGAGTPTLGTDLRGRVCGIVGLGQIGTVVAQTVHHGFGMQVRYTNRSGRTGLIGERCELDELLRTADVLTLHAPLTPQTKQLIGARELALMKPEAILVNTSRGDLVDEAALIQALQEGRLAGAGLDVVEHEPLDPASPLATLPNVMVTPHMASATVQTRRAMAERAIDNLAAALAGDEPPNPVNRPDRGAS